MSKYFWLKFSESVTETIDVHAEREAKSRREVVRDALGLYAAVHEEAWKGAQVILQYPDGSSREIILESIPRVDVGPRGKMTSFSRSDRFLLIIMLVNLWTATVLGMARLLEDRDDAVISTDYLMWVGIGMTAAFVIGYAFVGFVLRWRDRFKIKLSASEQQQL